MASYFVACEPQPDGAYPVHDRSLCPPRCFPGEGATEYLGEFLDAHQALAVARLRYRDAYGCVCASASTAAVPARVEEPQPAFTGVVGALRT